MPRKLHLIERLSYITKIEGDIFESGFWAVAPTTAETLVGGDIYFHKKKKESSYFGGKILGYRLYEGEDYPGRIIFRFEYSRAHKNVLAGEQGWSFEKKIV